jgi:hypothetical protein
MAVSHDRLEAYDLAQKWLTAWFLERYEDPGEECPYESAEGGYQFIWGGPFRAEDVLIEAWAGIFGEPFLMAVAAHIEAEHGCLEWSTAPDEDGGPCGICGRLADRTCDTCARALCWAHTHVRRQEWDAAGWDGIDLLCEEHAEPRPGYVIDPPRAEEGL